MVFEHLEISNGRERTLVGVADAVLTAAAWPLSIVRPPRRGAEPRRILLLRLERIGDLLMTLGAIRAVRLQAPDAVIDLVVGSWNASLAALVGGIDRIEVMDAPWLSRGSGGQSLARMARRTRGWRRQHYDLAINFEGDIRSHLLMAGSLARRRIGFDMAGGGPLLTGRVRHDPRRHTAENALALVETAFELPPGTLPRPDHADGRPLWRIDLTASLVTAARRRLAAGGIPEPDARPLVAIHPAGGRAIKQWPAERFAAVARALARSVGARVLLTGADADRALVEEVAAALRPDVDVHVIAGDVDLPVLAAVLARCHLLVTGDTGPMHLAAAVDTPIVAVFGPSDPTRYAPLTPRARVVRVDLPCSPCNRIRQPPARCVGHTPDCLDKVTVEIVVQAAREVLAAPAHPVALGTP
jgi:lipopolysaccharide heptosyltransferase II